MNGTQTLKLDHATHILVAGLGVTGLSVVRYLSALGKSVAVIDSRVAPPNAELLQKNYPAVPVSFGDFDSSASQQLIKQADYIVINPGLSRRLDFIDSAIKRGIPVVGDIELFLQVNQKPVIAVTGSNGKSTTCSLVADMLTAGGKSTLLAGNIGNPALDALTDGVDYEVAVLELSSFQLESVFSLKAQAAALLNISEDHMDRYATLADYTLAKARILKGAQHVILPQHDTWLSQITHASDARHFANAEPQSASSYGVKRISGSKWLCHDQQPLMPAAEIALLGEHNILNVLAAFALVESFALDLQACRQAVKAFQGLAHRMQTVAVENDIIWVNDSKATNVGAALTALNSIHQPIVWIAGGDAKQAAFSELQTALKARLKLVIAIGQDRGCIIENLPDSIAFVEAESLHQAVELAYQQAESGDVVLLSPACASFDMFIDYIDRGQQFASCVYQQLQQGAA